MPTSAHPAGPAAGSEATVRVVEVRPLPPPGVTAPEGSTPVVVLGCLLLFACGLVAWLLVHRAAARAMPPARRRPQDRPAA
jgi:hypothetical protein